MRPADGSLVNWTQIQRSAWLRFAFASLLIFLRAFVEPWPAKGQDRCELFYSSRGLHPNIKTPEQASEAERKVQKDPSDVETLMQLLDYFLCHSDEQEFQESRTRVILWTIQNHPDLHFTGGHDDRGLFINPDDKEAYARARNLWLEKAERYPYFPDVLFNAARSLKLTDREKAAAWLEGMGEYGRVLLAEVYADAITGVAGESPFQAITSIDRAKRDSQFAESALEEAGKDKELAARAGWNLHLISNAFHYEKLDSADFDLLAEGLLLKSAELSYPQPVEPAYLDAFYRSQELKPTDKRVVSRAKVVRVPPEEQAARLAPPPLRMTAPVAEPATVTVDIVVGVDGHVWEAAARKAGSEMATRAAVGAARQLIYQPLKVNGQLVRVASSVEVTVQPPGGHEPK